ncbi:hypothetical protein [Wolbachia endosymbiont of Oedothorax gibbosus]|uniref:hypothetical protein n=1 Tax=Wolbachia endosymbiont of Oedothorax gibbosus TaxID=931100 RepID=UPI00202525F8|nr:hypothetical protein [Wolbachia endosymbiont of Oedothorax gibbosus]
MNHLLSVKESSTEEIHDKLCDKIFEGLGITVTDMFYVIANITPEQIKRFDNMNHNGLLKILIEKRIVRNVEDLREVRTDRILATNMQNNIFLTAIILNMINKRIIRDVDDLNDVLRYGDLVNNLGEVLEYGNLTANMKDNPFLTIMILNIDDLVEVLGANGIKELISHSQYAESSNYLLKNCRLALVLYQKGAIEDITIDDLLDEKRIQTQAVEFFSENTRNNKKVPPGLAKELFAKSASFTNSPVSKLEAISLAAFIESYRL